LAISYPWRVALSRAGWFLGDQTWKWRGKGNRFRTKCILNVWSVKGDDGKLAFNSIDICGRLIFHPLVFNLLSVAKEPLPEAGGCAGRTV
jgi:hypothetical protein